MNVHTFFIFLAIFIPLYNRYRIRGEKMLKDLFQKIDYQLLQGHLEQEITDICYHTKEVKENCLFVCIQGVINDGHDYISEAISKGAIAIVVSRDVDMIEGITYLKVAHTRHALALLSCAYFDNPSHKMIVIGITGTKGKTSTSYMIASVLQNAYYHVGIIGTIGYMINGSLEKTKNTTPESYEIQKIMYKMVESGCQYCVMEVSSQGLKLNRVDGIQFDYGIFTNLSSDHISPHEHHSFEEYLSCKKQLFQMCHKGFFNKDDRYYKDMIQGAKCLIQTYSIYENSDLKANDISYYRDVHQLGMTFHTSGQIHQYFQINMPGYFSIYNALATILLCQSLSIPINIIYQAFQRLYIPGRMEIIPTPQNYTVIIDYAHNAFAYENLLETILQYHPHHIICVYGAGGHRDHQRRYDVGKTVAKYKAFSLLTADNPRGESVQSICNDIIKGIKEKNGQYKVIENRQEAICYALKHAQDGDFILCLGKGHEDYQTIDKSPLPFSEREIIQNFFNKMTKKDI